MDNRCARSRSYSTSIALSVNHDQLGIISDHKDEFVPAMRLSTLEHQCDELKDSSASSCATALDRSDDVIHIENGTCNVGITVGINVRPRKMGMIGCRLQRASNRIQIPQRFGYRIS